MTAQEIKDFLYNNGCIDCGDNDDVKIEVLNLLEEIGLEIGFDKARSCRYRYVYSPYYLEQVHMRRTIEGESVIPADKVLSLVNESHPLNAEDFYDWVEFFAS